MNTSVVELQDRIRTTLDDSLFELNVPMTAETSAMLRDRLKNIADEYLESLTLNKQIQNDSKVQINGVVDWYVRWTKRRTLNVIYIQDDGNEYRVPKRFRSLRLARVYGKRTWRGMMIQNMWIQPVQPLEDIVLNCTITKDGMTIMPVETTK